jgi:hypothetical protein
MFAIRDLAELAFAASQTRAIRQRILDSDRMCAGPARGSLRSNPGMRLALTAPAALKSFGFGWESCGRRICVLPRRTAGMTIRTTKKIVRFSSTFSLAGLDLPQPAGEYLVDHDEVVIEGVSRIAWRRVGAYIHLPAIAVQSAMQQMVPIDPADLEAALEKDQAGQ